MFEQDYIMRMIKELVRAILKLLFNIETESPTAELLEAKEEKAILESLLDMVDDGKINEAENRLCDLNDSGDISTSKISLLFYSYLNDKTDDFLISNDFSRDEIKSGLEKVAESLGLESVSEMFLTDL